MAQLERLRFCHHGGWNGYEFSGMVRRDGTFSPADIDRLFRNPPHFSDATFLSTTTNPDGVFAGNTIIRIQGESGILVESLSRYPSEAEVLFRPRAQFKVLEIIDATVTSKAENLLQEILK